MDRRCARCSVAGRSGRRDGSPGRTKGWLGSACGGRGLVVALGEGAIDFPGSGEVEHLSRPVVEPVGDVIEIVLGMAAEIGAFRQVLADEAVGVLVAAALPG